MFSKAKIAGHPIHPMLVGFPIAFYTATSAAYIFYAVASPDPYWFRVAYVANVAGVATALVAAVPGFIDWAFGVPTGSPAKITGFFHMLLNVLALSLFSASAWTNYSQYRLDNPNARWGVALSLLGVGLTMVAGFLGWKMVGTHHVGVDLTPDQERIDPTFRKDTRPVPAHSKPEQPKNPKGLLR